MIAFCGLNCHECDANMATGLNDDEKREHVAKLWSEQYNADIKPEDINCDGCQSDGDRLFNHTKVCEIRKCGKEKGVVNCAHCEEFPCNKLEEFFKMAPDAKRRLEEIRNTG